MTSSDQTSLPLDPESYMCTFEIICIYIYTYVYVPPPSTSIRVILHRLFPLDSPFSTHWLLLVFQIFPVALPDRRDPQPLLCKDPSPGRCIGEGCSGHSCGKVVSNTGEYEKLRTSKIPMRV